MAKTLQHYFEVAGELGITVWEEKLLNWKPHPLPRSSSLIKSFRKEIKQGRLPDGRFAPKQLTLHMNSYGLYLDSGRRKGARQPPPAAMLQFVKKRRLRGRNRKGRFIKDRQLAFLIGRSISKNGIKPRNFIDAGTRAAWNYLNSNEVERGIQQWVFNDLDKVWGKQTVYIGKK